MSELLKKAEGLSQNPSMGNIIGIIQEIARKIENPETTTSMEGFETTENIEAPKRIDMAGEEKPKKRKKKNV